MWKALFDTVTLHATYRELGITVGPPTPIGHCVPVAPEFGGAGSLAAVSMARMNDPGDCFEDS